MTCTRKNEIGLRPFRKLTELFTVTSALYDNGRESPEGTSSSYLQGWLSRWQKLHIGLSPGDRVFFRLQTKHGKRLWVHIRDENRKK